MKAISLAYHDVTDRASKSPAAPNALYKLDHRIFRNHILSITQRVGVNFAVQSIERFRPWKEEIPVFLTFDDGELGAYRYVADELEQQGWRGHFFITTNWIGRTGFMDRKQIRELRGRGHVIGSHSCSHPARMSCLKTNQLMKEWSESLANLCDILGEPVKVASVPDGYYSQNVGRTAADAGIEALFTSEAKASARVLNGCLILGRYFIQAHMPPEVSGAIARGRIWPRWRQSLLWQAKKPLKAVTGESYLAIRRRLVSRFLSQAPITDSAVTPPGMRGRNGI